MPTLPPRKRIPLKLPPLRELGTIISLFDDSGNWCLPYREAGYNVIQVDLYHGQDVMQWQLPKGVRVRGVLAAPPCDHMAGSGAQYWKAKDADGRTAAAVALFKRTIALIEEANPAWWCLENPRGRVNTLLPELKPFGPVYVQPWWFGDPYTKLTGLWGNFNRNLPRTPVAPIKTCPQGSWMQRLSGWGKNTKRLRSKTPLGFARAFFEANR